MYMCYAEASLPEAVDVISAVSRAQSLFSLLAFDAGHESVYGFGRYGTEEELQKLETQYRKAVSLCEKFERGKISCSCLVTKLDAMKLEDHTDEIKKFLKIEVQKNGVQSKV